jgi:aminoglycoside phosphotransferase (APT) family kinase protein
MNAHRQPAEMSNPAPPGTPAGHAGPADSAQPTERAGDWSRLEGYVRENFPELDGGFGITRFTGGRANLTYLVTIGSGRLVVRRPPLGDLAPGAHDMRREFRVLSRLWRSYDRAPRALLLCEDPDILGATFFVMEYRHGIVVRSTLPDSLVGEPAAGHRLGLAVVDALADLHCVDPASCGLEDLGRPDGFVSRQLSGWGKRWDLVRDGSPPAMDVLASRLEQSQPRSSRAAILHNDLKLDNCQFEPGRPDRVYSVFDWDMATLGDPLIDLGILLNYSPDSSDTAADRGIYDAELEQLGLPSRAELIARYCARTGADASAIAWYEAFACWKTAIAIRQLEVRYLSGKSDDAGVVQRARQIPALIQRATRLLAQA